MGKQEEKIQAVGECTEQFIIRILSKQPFSLTSTGFPNTF